MQLSNCTKNRQINNNTTFMNGKKSLKNCAKCTSSDEFSDSLGRGIHPEIAKYSYGSWLFRHRRYYVDTEGKNAKKIQEDIQNQTKEDMEYTQMAKRVIDLFTGEPAKQFSCSVVCCRTFVFLWLRFFTHQFTAQQINTKGH